jgi:hypothetical protein
MNFKMIKSEMVVLTRREKTDVTDADVAIGWKLQPTAGTVVGERERESWCDMDESEIQARDHWNQPKKNLRPWTAVLT